MDTPDQTTRRYRVRYGGTCQHVGFRFTSLEFARKFGVSGWVHNEMDGTVTAELQATDDVLGRYLEELEAHYAFYEIEFTIEEMEETPIVAEDGFEVRF